MEVGRTARIGLRIERDVRVEQTSRGVEKRLSGPSRRKPEHMREQWWKDREVRMREYVRRISRGGRLFEEETAG